MDSYFVAEEHASSTSKGVSAKVLIFENEAHLYTSKDDMRTIRYKYELYKALGMLISIGHNGDSIILVVKRLYEISKMPRIDDLEGEEYYCPHYDQMLNERFNIRQIHSRWNKSLRSLYQELATNPFFPIHNVAYSVALGLEGIEDTYPDDADRNYMYDRENDRIIPIDVLFWNER